MKLNIYSKESSLRLTIEADSNNVASCGIQEDSILSLSFSTFECVPLEVYDYIDFEGDRYWVLERYIPQMNSRRSWSYSVQLHGVPGLASQTLMVNTADADNPIFNLTAPAREHAALIIANLNRVMNTTEWKVGEVIVSEYIDIEYTGKYASDALSELSSAAGTEWWFDGMTLNISRCEFGEAIPLAYGNGLIGGITPSMAEGVKFFTRLFPVGSSRNIDPDHYGYARLQLPDRAKYVEQDTHLGLVEHFEQEAFEGIFPRRIGTVGTVRTIEKKGEDGKPFTIYYFTDPEIPFNPNDYEIGGLVKRITFQSGELRGREFEVNYESSKKEFEIITQWPYDDDTQLPSEPLVPAPGDEYILWNIRMPESYYTEAEQEFRQAVDDFMKESRKNISVFQTSTDFTVIEKRGLVLKPGQRIRLESQQMFPDTGYRETRIVSISRSIGRPATMDLKLSDVLSTGRISRIEQSIEQIDRYTKQVAAEFPDIIRSWEETPPSDTTLYSSRKSEREFLNKRVGGTVEGVARFLKQLLLDEGFRTANFASGITGVGAQIDSVGAAEMESLTLRRFLEVPQLNYNRVDIAVGDEWSAPGGGVIERVDTQQQIITLRLEEGEVGSARAGDICMGIFHSSNPEQNATEDADDSRGNRRFAGFATVYFQVTEVSGEQNQTLHYERRPVSQNYAQALDPFEAMTFVCYGSFTDPARRTSRYSTRTYQRYLKGVADWEFTVDNIAAQFGDLTNLSVFGIQMSGYSAYLDNIYLQGMVSSLDKKVLLDTRSKLFRMVGDNGVGVAFTPEAGWKQGKLYDPETGQFQKEFDIEQIDQTAREAAQAAATAQQDANTAAADVSSLKNFTDEAFTDGVISRAEASSIEKYTNSVEETQKSADASYTTVYNNSLLSGTAKSNLQAAKSTFDTAVADLLSAIRTASDDGIATPEEKAGVDSQYALFNDAYSAFCTRLEEANEYIQTAINTAAQGAYQLSQELQGVVNNINETILPDLQDQIDKSIISWGGEEVPTLDNYPANEWTTDTERKRHINDGYDRKITTDGEVSYESYKFVFENGVYQWNRIADSGSAAAIAEARKALGLAGTKARVFYGSATPSVPYEVNDVWFRTSGSGGSLTTTLYISNADKGDGETASADDWQLVDDSQVRLRQMSSDQVISREEKAVLRNTLAQTQKEFATYQSDADTYGISITALSTAYNSLVNFLTGTVAVNNDTDTTLTQSQRTDYNARFAAYTSEVARFSNLIADAISQGKVDGLQFGARNYIAKVYISDWNNNSQGKTDIVLTGSDTDGSYQSVNYRAVQEIISSGDSTRADIFRGRIKFQENMQYSFKVRWKLLYEMSSTVRGMYFVFIYTDGTMEFVPIYGNQTSLVETVYSTKEGKTLDRISASYSQFDAGGKTNRVLIYDIQLTEGNKAPTGYITAEEDVQAQIEQVKLDVDYIASDSSLTPSDKQQVANEWVRIQNEYWSIIANAAKYDVPTDTFTTYFQRLEDYLTPLLADMSTTSEITGTEFRKLFSDYYEVSNTMSDLIDDAIDESIKSTEYLKQAMEDGSTEVKGGLVMTNVMLMKNRQGEVTAGVSGLQEDNVPFWSGADYTNRKKAVFRVHADGEVHATKGTIGIMQVKNDSVEVSDATASGNKIILTTNNINSVSQVLGSSEVPSSQTTERVSVITSQTKPFASDSRNSSQFKCGAEVQMSAQVKGTIRGGGSVKIEIFNQTADTTDTIFQQSSADAGTGSIQINKNIGYRFNTPAYYYIKVSVEASSSGELGSTASAAVEAITFSFVTDVRKNLIAPNGVAVVKGSSNYAVFTGDIFEVLIGKAGLRIQNGYVYKRDTDHTTWTKI